MLHYKGVTACLGRSSIWWEGFGCELKVPEGFRCWMYSPSWEAKRRSLCGTDSTGLERCDEGQKKSSGGALWLNTSGFIRGRKTRASMCIPAPHPPTHSHLCSCTHTHSHSLTHTHLHSHSAQGHTPSLSSSDIMYLFGTQLSRTSAGWGDGSVVKRFAVIIKNPSSAPSTIFGGSHPLVTPKQGDGLLAYCRYVCVLPHT